MGGAVSVSQSNAFLYGFRARAVQEVSPREPRKLTDLSKDEIIEQWRHQAKSDHGLMTKYFERAERAEAEVRELRACLTKITQQCSSVDPVQGAIRKEIEKVLARERH